MLNRLNALTYNGQTPNYTFGYDALSRRTSLTRPNAITTSYGYTPQSWLNSVLHKNSGCTVLDGATYTLDNVGNRKTRTDKRTNVTLTYGPDNIYQLLSAKQGTTTKESYTYDLVGNRLTSLGVSQYNYNSSNELTSTPSGSYTYDNNGNRKSDPSGATYAWDYENRLTQEVLAGAGGTATFKYDPFGRRAQKIFTKNGVTTTTNYLYDGFQLIEEVDPSGNLVARYTNGPAIDQPLGELRAGTTSYYQQDALSSVTSLSNGTAALANTYTYDSFGKLTASTGTLGNPFQYTGREFDSETGTYFYRARYFDPTAGRFIAEDPIRFTAGVNFYAYVGNLPTSRTDPFGMASALDGMVGGLGNIFPGSEYHPGPNGDAVGSWIVVHMPCSEVYKILEAQGYQTGIFPPFNNPFDHSGGWEFRTYGPGFHYRVQYPPISLPYPSRTNWPDSGSSCPNTTCTIDQFHIDDPNPMNGMGDAWGHFKKFLASHGF